ncbi:MAG: hypothetical protein U1E33_06780 [Rhodospirillales bacterium]
MVAPAAPALLAKWGSEAGARKRPTRLSRSRLQNSRKAWRRRCFWCGAGRWCFRPHAKPRPPLHILAAVTIFLIAGFRIWGS